MRKLLTTLATAATAALGFAEIAGTEGFEDSSYTAYDNNKPSQEAAYPFDGYGDYYRSLDDDGEEELSADDASCVDAVMQFKYADAPDEFDGGEKLVVFANSDGKLVVVDADAANVTTTDIAEDTWYRLTIVSVDETVNDAMVKKFKVYVNGVLAKTEGGADSFKSRVADSNSVATMTLSGTGKLDNFVARTTNPFYSGEYAASVGTGADNEKYANYSDALADVLSSGATDAITIAGETPRTVNGTAANPYEITNLADLKALQAAVAAGKGADKCYLQTDNIALDVAWPGIGVQNGKDLVNYTVGTGKGEITQEEADRRSAKWSAGAFKGTYDGGNYTISNFQMVGVAGNPDSTTEGLDYCGFFNSVDGATIKNLKIAYAGSLFATDTTASTKESGATFVGVAKNSTLQNLTSLEGTVSCSKGFGGIVGYLMGSAVESCTNNVNLTSLAKNKCGGIAMICQQANCSISNCKNNGTITTESGEHGGIIGYTDTITISDCENTAACKMFYHHGGTVTLSGANKGNATVVSYTGVATPGLNFAMVDGNVATFVADNALAADNTYKVMGPGAAYAFAQAGTISFDEALAAATVTAAEGLVLTTSTSGTVTTYTAAAAVAKIGDTKYTSLAAALADADGKTVTLAADITLTGAKDAIEFPAKVLTLDLNGYTIGRFANSYYVLDIPNGADVTIKDTSVAGTGMVKGTPVASGNTKNPASMIRLKGKLTLASGSLVSDYCCVKVDEDPGRGEFVMNGGTLEVIANDKGYTGLTFTIMNWGVATINAGTHKGNVQSLSYSGNNVSKTSTLTINGGSFDPANIYLLPYDTTYAPTVKIVSTIDNLTVVNAGKASLNWEVKNLADETVSDKTYKVYSLSQIPQGFPGGADGKTFNIDTAVQAALAEKIPEGKALTNAVAGVTSGMTYAQAYALGLLNEETGAVAKDVTPTIEIKDGKVVISLDTAAKDAYKVTLTVYESTSLEANATWSVKDTYELGSETEAAGFTPAAGGSGFYKVSVTIEDANN